jgi:hypothetical protein
MHTHAHGHMRTRMHTHAHTRARTSAKKREEEKESGGKQGAQRCAVPARCPTVTMKHAGKRRAACLSRTLFSGSIKIGATTKLPAGNTTRVTHLPDHRKQAEGRSARYTSSMLLPTCRWLCRQCASLVCKAALLVMIYTTPPGYPGKEGGRSRKITLHAP